MKKIYLERLRYIFVPYLLVSLGYMIVSFLFFKWFIIEYNLMNSNNDFFGYIQFIIPYLVLHLILGKRLKIFTKGISKGVDFYVSMMSLVIICSLMNIFKSYNVPQTKLITIRTVSEVYDYPNNRYFEIKNYEIDRRKIYSENQYIQNGSGYKFLYGINSYYTTPFDSVKSIFFGKKYGLHLSNTNSYVTEDDVEKYLKNSDNDFRNSFISKPKHFSVVIDSNHYRQYKFLINEELNIENPIILEPTSKFINSHKVDIRDSSYYRNLGIKSYLIGSFLLMLLIVFGKNTVVPER